MAITRRELMTTVLTAGAAAAIGSTNSALADWLDNAGGPGAAGTAPRPKAQPPTQSGRAALRLSPTPACDDGDAEPTPSATAGPFYTPNTPERDDLREPGTVGTPLILEGRILTPDCRPLPGAVLDLWSADGNGVYDNRGFRLRGHLKADRNGLFRVRTVKPGAYGDRYGRRPPHIHVRAQGQGTRLLTTQVFFPDETVLNAQDGLFEKALLVSLARDSGVLVARFDFVLG